VTFFNPTAAPVMGADAGDTGWSAPDAPVIMKTEKPAPAVDAAPETASQPSSTREASAAKPAQPAAQPTKPANSWTTSAPVSTDAPAATATPKSEPQRSAASWGSPQSSDEVQVASRSTMPRSAMAMGQTGGVTNNKPITIDVQGADIKTVLRSISEFSGANIVAGPEVEGAVTIHLVNVPWKEALDTILKSQGYSYRDEYGIYRVQQTKVLHEEEIAEVQVARKKEEMQPLVSRVVRLSFANAEEVSKAMKEATTRRGSVEVEKGSNAVIVTDIAEYAERVAALCMDLDRKVSQVEIVAKLVDVDVEATREMGIKWDFLNIQSADLNGNASASVGNSLVDPFGAFRVGTVQSWGDLMVAVDALERENKANIVSHPRVVTADNKESSILVGKEIPLIVSDEAGNPITELKKIGVMLRVTPHINSDRTITMDIHPEVSELSSQATVQGGVIISLTSADTRVIVADGETAVIGGLINEVETKTEEGLPGLMDVPLLGNLFKYSNKVKKKRELIIFITPKIIS
jgi:type IV pilus assembly protein PilQ